MSVVHQRVALVVHKARQSALAIQMELEASGDPETTQSNTLYLALVSIKQRLFAVDPPPAPIAQFVAELDQLTRQCEGKLASIKPLIEEALRVARQG